MKIIFASIVAVVVIVGVGYNMTWSTSHSSTSVGVQSSSQENSVIKDGIQYVTIQVQGGYSPKKSVAQAGVPTKLIMKTNGTYDCSTSLVIRSLNYRAMLPNTGETSIDAGTPKIGDVLQGMCGMGMYGFIIAFK